VRPIASLFALAALTAGLVLLATHTTIADPGASPTPGASAAASPAASASAAAAATVDIKDFAYKPDTLTVAVGKKVTFTNSDDTAHTVTSTDKAFDSGNLDKNASWSHVFEKAGTYTYVCAYHAFMKGTIVVK
jgi:plastocyanin